jgi:sulfite exporter TauE/SafE
MDPGAAIATGLMLGLSSGGYCFWSCASVMGPYMVATDDATTPLSQRWASVAGAFRALGWYNLGRLVAYLAAGLVVSLVAGQRQGVPAGVHAATLLATAGLLAYAVVRPAQETRCWRGRGRRSAGAFALGLLQGVSPCPPFLMAVGIALSAPGLSGGMLLFGSLFVGTAIFTLPLAFLEPLRRRRWLFWIMRGLGAVVCLYLVAQALSVLLGWEPGR